MPIFAHGLGDLDGSVVFKSLSLKTSNTPIEVQVSGVYRPNITS